MTLNLEYRRRGLCAISLWQPWASLVVLGLKRIETRHWTQNYRGPFIIHAAKKRGTPEQHAIYRDPLFRRVWPATEPLPIGAYLGVVTLVDIVPTDRVAERYPLILTEEERAFGNYAAGRFAWILRNPERAAEPLVAAGHQGIWTPDPCVMEKLIGRAA